MGMNTNRVQLKNYLYTKPNTLKIIITKALS